MPDIHLLQSSPPTAPLFAVNSSPAQIKSRISIKFFSSFKGSIEIMNITENLSLITPFSNRVIRAVSSRSPSSELELHPCLCHHHCLRPLCPATTQNPLPPPLAKQAPTPLPPTRAPTLCRAPNPYPLPNQPNPLRSATPVQQPTSAPLSPTAPKQPPFLSATNPNPNPCQPEKGTVSWLEAEREREREYGLPPGGARRTET